MHVLMISLDASLLGDPHGNTVQRHLEYARRIGDLSIVTYNPAAAAEERAAVRGQFHRLPDQYAPGLVSLGGVPSGGAPAARKIR